MPNPLNVRTGAYDDPPATSDDSTATRRQNRLQRALHRRRVLEGSNTPAPTFSTMNNSERRRVGGTSFLGRRRRRRSSSPLEESLEDVVAELESSRRPKRRRFDSPPPPPHRKPIKYGWYGQVEPGRLQMELVSCDGGEHRDPRNPGVSLGPENLLRYDKSVYCSERDNSNIVIRHADDTPFCLETLHIIGPENGFTAPVRAGTVHVAMKMRDLHKYAKPPPHAQRASFNPHWNRYGTREAGIPPSPEERLTLQDALRDPEVNAAMIGRSLGDGPDEPGSLYLSPSSPIIHSTSFERSSTPSPTSLDPNNLICTLDFDTERLGPEDPSPQEIIDFRQHRQTRHNTSRRRYDIDHWDRDDGNPTSTRRLVAARFTRAPSFPTFAEIERSSDRQALSHLDVLMARSRVHDSPTTTVPPIPSSSADTFRGIDLDNIRPEDIIAMESTYVEDIKKMAVEDDAEDADVRTRRFYIKTGKSRVAMHFDPPVSGKFIMLKLESGLENVDVQAVVAEGYGGARFFPAVAVR